MTEEILLREFIAVSQKLKDDPQYPYGKGYNFTVEVAFRLSPENTLKNINETRLRQRLRVVLGRLDHKALGLDVDFGFEPETAALCRFIFTELDGLGVTRVALTRGDGLSVSYWQP